jgi:hypothetical protein
LAHPTTDSEAWLQYRHHRRYFNKLDLALRLGHNAGPSGTVPEEISEYIIRPCYNLEGMGVDARFVTMGSFGGPLIKPGEFWCERFYGDHISIDYTWQDSPSSLIHGNLELVPTFACQGFRTNQNLYRFNAWRRISPPLYKLPRFLTELVDVRHINIEFIGGKIIEIHLRPGASDFPLGATDIIPIWSDDGEAHRAMLESKGWSWFPYYDDAGGHMKVQRLGFMFR